MKSNSLVIVLAATSALLGSVAPAAAAIFVGGVDPAAAPTTGLQSDTADTFMVISNQFTYTTTAAEIIDLGASTFSFQSNANPGAAATPFLAIQTGPANSHSIADYDVILTGSPLGGGAFGTDVSAAFGAGTFVLPAGSTIVAGFFGSAPGGFSPVSATFGGGASTDVLVIAQTSVDVVTDLTLIGASDWSGNGAVTDRLYHYQVNLAVVPEPTSSLLLGLAGFSLLLRRRR